MKDDIDKIIEQQTIIAEMLGIYDPPTCKNGIDENSLILVEYKLQNLGFFIPNSYKSFLMIYDGIKNISCSFNLLGSKEFLDDLYSLELLATLEIGVGFEFDPLTPPLLIGMSTETNTKVFFEYSHERKQENEPIVLEGEPGFYTLHYSFYEFLKCRIEANIKTIKTLKEYMQSRNP